MGPAPTTSLPRLLRECGLWGGDQPETCEAPPPADALEKSCYSTFSSWVICPRVLRLCGSQGWRSPRPDARGQLPRRRELGVGPGGAGSVLCCALYTGRSVVFPRPGPPHKLSDFRGDTAWQEYPRPYAGKKSVLGGLLLFYFRVLEEEEAVPRTSFLHPAGWQEQVLERGPAGWLGRSQPKAP